MVPNFSKYSCDPEQSRGTSSEPLVGKTSFFFHLPNRSHLVKLRRQRQHFSQLKFKKARKIAKILSFIPSVKLIAVTGALAMNNSDKNDDIDLMIVTKTNRLWPTRLLTILILELLKSRRRPTRPRWFGTSKSVGSELLDVPEFRTLVFSDSSEPSISKMDKICLNLFLDESALAIPKSRQNLYTAHEVCQIKPLYSKNKTYEKFLSLNSWVKAYLPNAIPKGQSLTGDPANGRVGTAKPEGLSLMKKFLNLLNLLAFHFQHAYMKPKITREKISLHSAFFHPRPTGKIVLKKYKQRLQSCGVPNFSKYSCDPEQSRGTSSEPSAVIKVLVTGCFDVLHQEHKNFLKAAKKQGDILLVGLETDSRVKKLKGKDRPINTVRNRIKNLKALNIADQVFVLPKKFDSPKDHLALINQIKPNILAVSSHTPNLPAKRRLMKSIGRVVLVVLPHNSKFSTTKIIRGS